MMTHLMNVLLFTGSNGVTVLQQMYVLYYVSCYKIDSFVVEAIYSSKYNLTSTFTFNLTMKLWDF